MATCPFAVQKPFNGPSGSYTGGPFKIVHHTTEGPTAVGAFGAYQANRSDPHFTVDATTIYQHIDTDVAARALRNPPGGVQTNRDSAVQIEIVGFAHRAKAKDTLRNVARLCRWLEATHDVPRIWPNGPPKPAINGKDPGGHNRDPDTWNAHGGHYGHSQVPENIHWDPGFTADEARFVLEYDPADLTAGEPGWADTIPETDPDLSGDSTRMPDHHHIEEEPSAVDTEGVTLTRRGREAAALRKRHRPSMGASLGTGLGVAALGFAVLWALRSGRIAPNNQLMVPGHAPEEGGDTLSGSALRGPLWTPNDLRRQFERTEQEGWMPFFEEAAAEFGFDADLLLGIASRETNIQQIVGDGGHGHGIMQIDDRYHAEFVGSGRWRDPRQNILKGADILARAWADIEAAEGRERSCVIAGRRLQFTVPPLSPDESKRTAVAAYNSGCRALYWMTEAGDPDHGTTGRNYVADTLARSTHFRRFRNQS